ncbi:terpene synthase family, metal binding domain-containing protein [Fusarium oxysporum]|nr:terpene synthase family, metal binding domain-containing protein [Fusarium oxysporum]
MNILTYISGKIENGTHKDLKTENELVSAAKSLLDRAFKSHHSYYGLCSTSCQVYDTAWVAMISKKTDNVKHWLFPECLHYLLKTQAADGSWGNLPTTQTAGILDTASALLALVSHVREPLQILDFSPDEMCLRIEHGVTSLKRQLAVWNDVEETNHIGVELIVPALLSMLEKELGVSSFEFPSRDILDRMHEEKLGHFELEKVYGKPSSVLHSLEAFLGKVDFDRLSHHLYRGSMMASPSSTAAYLIGATKWHDEAEDYLRHVMRNGAGHGDGGISGTFPTTHFECSWILATLLKGGFTVKQIDCDGSRGLSTILADALRDENGVIGFAPHTADVDDTAKALLALSLVNQPVSPDIMIKVFEGKDHFTTFGSERDPSLTSNLHVLLSLLKQPNLSQYHPQILKTTLFICQWWWDSDHHIKDKWNLSHLYPTMLLVEAFTDVLHLIDGGELSGLFDENIKCKIGLSVFQAVLRIVFNQDDDGSWRGYREQTCYAILALAQARHVCFFAHMVDTLQSCIDRSVSWLKDRSLHSEDLTWTSKTAYEVGFVAEAYKLAALQSASLEVPAATVGHSLTSAVPSSDLEQYMRLVRKTALFSPLDEWELRSSIIESSFFVPLLQAQRVDIYPRDSVKIEEDKYLSIIPFTWIGCNNRNRTFASNRWLYDMMYLSLLGYQTDEYMEAVAGPVFGDISLLHHTIDKIIDNTRVNSAGTNGTVRNGNGHQHESSNIGQVEDTLTRFTNSVLNHKDVLRSSSCDQDTLRQEFRTFMHAHATQLEDNSRFSKQDSDDVFSSPEQSYFQWVNSTGGSHVACAYSFAFSNCLISANLLQGNDAFPSVTQKYHISSVMRHATNMCRMYNDFGSIARDNAERNVNSIHFPEFALSNGTSQSLDDRKKRLSQIATYEQACLDHAMEALERQSQDDVGDCPGSKEVRKLKIVKLFCDVTDLYDQLYVIKDLSSSMKVAYSIRVLLCIRYATIYTPNFCIQPRRYHPTVANCPCHFIATIMNIFITLIEPLELAGSRALRIAVASIVLWGATGLLALTWWICKQLFDEGALPYPLVGDTYAQSLEENLIQGMEKYRDSPFVLAGSRPPLLILPMSVFHEIHNMPNEYISIIAEHEDKFQGKYTHITTIRPEIPATIRQDVTRNMPNIILDFQDELVYASEQWPRTSKWASVPLYEMMLRTVALLSGRAFVGLPLCRDQAWLQASIGYTVDCISIRDQLYTWNPIIRPLIGPILSSVRSVRGHLRFAAKIMAPLISQALQEYGKQLQTDALPTDQTEGRGTFISWLLRHLPEELRTPEQVGLDQMLVSFAAIHTTTMALTKVVWELAKRPEYVEPLRAEMHDVFGPEVGTRAICINKDALSRLQKLDSFIKEVQRWCPSTFACRKRRQHSRQTLAVTSQTRPLESLTGFGTRTSDL